MSKPGSGSTLHVDASSALDVIRERYNQELAILLELLDAQTQFGAATINQIRAFYEYKVAQHTLSRAVGNAVP